MRIPLDQLRLKPNVPAGLNPYTVMGHVPLLRGSHEDLAPVTIGDRCPTCCSWRLLDGRHRFVASLMAGRSDILADIE